MRVAVRPRLDHPEVRAALDLLVAWIEYRLAYWSLPSLAIAVVHDQELLWARAFGDADVERGIPATPATRYRIGSITKLFTATAVMQLRDAGALRLDDPVARHLSWFTIAREPEHDGVELTVRQLLSHTTGLPREAAFPYWETFEFPAIAELREGLARQTTALAAESQWKYSNVAVALAGEIVAAASGMPYARYVERHILEPLGMRSTLVDGIVAGDPRLARGYSRRFPRAPREQREVGDLGGLVAAGNIASTVEDLARFAMLQLRTAAGVEPAVLAATTVKEMQRMHWLEPGWQAGWGLGFRIYREDGRTCLGHGGLLPGHAADLRVLPAEKIAVIVLANAEDAWPLVYGQRATALLAPAIAAAMSGLPSTPAPDPSLSRYLGRYRNTWGDSQVLLGPAGLRIVAPFNVDPTEGMDLLTPVGPDVFRIVSSNGYGAPGELVTFELGPEGTATSFKIGEHRRYRVAEW
ncbi:MAG: serine hydrolase [Candidatus Rokubacteria bacterium]|nr:serine hydrolase [Candidatus Rokubacteria bacterium]